MIIQKQPENELRPDQVRAMAHGLYHLAKVDGITVQERELIRTFLREGKVEMDLDALGKVPFSLEELLYSLDTIFLRKTFLKVCVLLAKADGKVTDEEVSELRRMSQAMGVEESFDAVVADLTSKRL